LNVLVFQIDAVPLKVAEAFTTYTPLIQSLVPPATKLSEYAPLLPRLAGLDTTGFPFGFVTMMKTEVELGEGAGEIVPVIVPGSDPKYCVLSVATVIV
jgi:hypothetical protein